VQVPALPAWLSDLNCEMLTGHMGPV
jgi:hypothetical protein